LYYCSPDAPVNRVTVTSNLVLPESPSPISPPNQIEEVYRGTVSPSVHSNKMAEHENPFRPEEVLYHEVDPIVEQYMHKPFPPSRPVSPQTTPIKQQKDGFTSKNFRRNGVEYDSSLSRSLSPPPYLQNGLSKEQLIDNEKAQTLPLLSPDQRHPSAVQKYGSTDAVLVDDLPPANKVELVHVNKKKCGCCSVQ
uniref:ZM domain-containing protein n=1 Tax=Angiostrongylus cantonensis TaxID=6313 RepID=A0A0K0CTP9_ANGCA